MAINGVDTTFLIEAEVQEHPGHSVSRSFLMQILNSNQSLALAPQVLSEFIHIVTDSRRFARPLKMADAVTRAHSWWMAKEVVQVFPNDESTRLFLDWMSHHNLGRKRLLDTQLAATYYANGVHNLITTNVRDFSIFEGFTLLQPT